MNDFIGCGMVSRVTRSPGVICKKYRWPGNSPADIRAVKSHWEREISALAMLAGEKSHFPKLIRIDTSNRSLFLTDCGSPVTKATLPPNWRKQVLEIQAVLSRKWMFHNDVFTKNICVKNGVLHLIDWGLWDSRPRRHNDFVGQLLSLK